MPAFNVNRVGLSRSIAITVLFTMFGRPTNAQQIDALVDEVSVANIEAHLRALTVEIGPRNTHATRAAAADYIAGQLMGFGYAVTRAPVVSEAPVLNSENVIAQLSGAIDPTKTLVIGAHFDSVARSPGADDNASGVAGFLEIARVLGNTRPAFSIDFVGFALEETPEGVILNPNASIPGSNTYVRDAAAQGRELLGVLNLEMIGYASSQEDSQFAFSDIPECMVFSEQGLTVGDYIAVAGNEDSASLVNAFQQAAAQFVPELHVLTGAVAGNGECFSRIRDSDHRSFWDAGHQGLLITDTANFRNPNYHQPSDTIDTLDLEFARNVTRATLATALASMSVPGDFNGDRVLTAEDIDRLSAEIRMPEPRLWFDTNGNGDGIVDTDDREFWVHDLRKTYFGDSNLDGEFGSGDLITVFQAGEYEDDEALNSTWATGDWNGDGDFDTGDMVFAFQKGGYEKGPLQALNAVPEPSSVLLTLMACLGLMMRRRD